MATIKYVAQFPWVLRPGAACGSTADAKGSESAFVAFFWVFVHLLAISPQSFFICPAEATKIRGAEKGELQCNSR